MTTSVLTLPSPRRLDMEIVREIPVAVRADESSTEDGRLATMEVRFSRFGTWYEIDSWWEGRFLERTKRGSFHKTISDNGATRVKVMFNHGMDMFIDQKLLGPIESLTEERDSPLGVVSLLDTTYNRDLLPGLRAGIYGSSFMFRVISDTWNHEPGVSEHNPEGIPERTITEVRLFEFGPVTWPANPDSTSGIRSTDVYYELLSKRDPGRVEALRSLRTKPLHLHLPELADAPLVSEAATTAVEPAQRHSPGMTARERRERLYPYLREETS